MNDIEPPNQGSQDREGEAILRLLRATNLGSGGDTSHIDDETLAAYVIGKATRAEAEGVQAAMLQDPALGRHVLELLELGGRSSTPDERRAFDRATVPPLERRPELSALARQLERKSPPAAQTIPTATRLRRKWVDWTSGGWAVATAAICALFVVMTRSPSPTPGGEEGFTARVQHAPKAPPYSFDVIASINLQGPTRGRESEVTKLGIPASITTILLKAEPPDVPDGSSVWVTLTGPDGQTLLHEQHPVEDFFRTRSLAVRSENGFNPGKYVLKIAGQRDSVPEEVEYPFLVNVRGG